MLVEVQYGYLDVLHVHGAVVVDVCIGFPVGRIWFAVEKKYQMVDVLHIRCSVRAQRLIPPSQDLVQVVLMLSII